MDASKVMLLYYHIVTAGCNKKHYVPTRIQCVNELVDKGKYNESSIIHNKPITLYRFHISCPFDSMVLSFDNSPECMIKIFI